METSKNVMEGLETGRVVCRIKINTVGLKVVTL